jgi:putative ABC transport system substrate-binding protein
LALIRRGWLEYPLTDRRQFDILQVPRPLGVGNCMQLDQLKRREFISLLSVAAAWTFAARAQEPAPTVRQARVGILSASPPTPAMLNAFREGMRERGYIEGQNLSIDVRWPQGTFEQDPAVAVELAGASAEVIVAWSTPAVIAARRATSAIPIVLVSVGDPVGAGFIASLARPGGNITGLSNIRSISVQSSWSY